MITFNMLQKNVKNPIQRHSGSTSEVAVNIAQQMLYRRFHVQGIKRLYVQLNHNNYSNFHVDFYSFPFLKSKI